MKEKLAINDQETSITSIIQKEEEKNWKKYILIGVPILVVIIIIIVLIIILAKEDKKTPHISIGEILYTLDIDSNSKEIDILGNEYNKQSSFDIYIDDNLSKYSKKYIFKTTGIHEIKIVLYENINMDYMFKDVKSLISIEMNSTSNASIISMISTFENCNNLENIEVNGFLTNEIKSINKIFYNTKLYILDISWLNTSNIEDMSYMFALSTIIEIDLSKIDTNSVKNISYMFYKCESLLSIDLNY